MLQDSSEPKPSVEKEKNLIEKLFTSSEDEENDDQAIDGQGEISRLRADISIA